MTKKLNETYKYFILSAESQDSCNTANEVKTLLLVNYLEKHKFSYKPVIGKYKGETEKSFVVLLDENDAQNNALLRFLFTIYKQESVLGLTKDKENGRYRLAYLIYSDFESEFIGLFQNVSKEQAMREHGFTYCPVTDEYFTVLSHATAKHKYVDN